jgi:tRNA pseudouridine38-40 synthase
MKRNVALLVEFDGTLLHGWQSQKNGRSVQVELEKAVLAVMGPSSRLHGCSRTDAGVHAVGHVSNFRTESGMPVAKIPLALNSRLPEDISVLAAADVPAGFHARHDAVAKTYAFRIWNHPSPTALRRFDTVHVPKRLDVDRMNEAAAFLLGRHDFTTFMAAGSSAASPVRTLHRVHVHREGRIVTLEVGGDGFLYNMVRIIAGTLCFVGLGKIDPTEMTGIVDARDRKRAGKTMPARGLTLVRVDYDAPLFPGFLPE